MVKRFNTLSILRGGCKENVKTRCLNASQVFYQLLPILGHTEITMTTKTQIIKAVFTQLYLTRVKTGHSPAKKGIMLTTTEMRCLRKAAGKTRMDKIRNEEIRRRINMQPAEQTTNKSKIRCWSHVNMMAPTAPQNKSLVIQPEGRRPRGRPRTHWEDDVLMGIPMTGVDNWVKERRPIVYPLDADGRRVRLK